MVEHEKQPLMYIAFTVLMIFRRKSLKIYWKNELTTAQGRGEHGKYSERKVNKQTTANGVSCAAKQKLKQANVLNKLN